MSQLWQKNDQKTVNRDWFFDFTASEDKKYDVYLIPYDIKCNLAQVEVLTEAGLMSDNDGKLLSATLLDLFHKWQNDEFQLADDDEDVHSAIENYLTDVCGEPGKRIHTGRSRNDQVLTDIRLYTKDQLLELVRSWLETIRLFQDMIHRYPDVFFAGFTHTQSAMPHSVDAWASGYIDLLVQDIESVISAYKQADRCPLGSAAGFGVPYLPLNRQLSADLLGFSEVQHAVAGSQLQRGILEKKIVDALGYTAHTFNRLASDIIFYTSPVLGIVELSDDQTSGSSIMPQKRNPDAWELIRSTYSQLAGISAQLSIVSVNLTSGYHRDLQVTKKSLIDGLMISQKLINAVNICLKGVRFNIEKCKESLSPEIFATHRANKLVLDGVPFRDAYKIAGENNKNIPVPDRNTLMQSYTVTGYPGNYNELMFKSHIEHQKIWLESEQHKATKINKNLFKK